MTNQPRPQTSNNRSSFKRGRQLFGAATVLAGVVWSAQIAAQEDWAPPGFHVFSAGTPAVASQVNENFRWIIEHFAQASPPGAIVAFAGSADTVPAGWLLCDGTEVSASDYPELAAVLGSAWGAAEEGNIKLPDLRGRFTRGLDPSGQFDDASREVGSYQEDALQQIEGTIPRVYVDSVPAYEPSGAYAWGSSGSMDVAVSGGADSRVDVTFDSSRVARSAEETRPKNIAVNYIIKF